jgi:hypothetical protein
MNVLLGIVFSAQIVLPGDLLSQLRIDMHMNATPLAVLALIFSLEAVGYQFLGGDLAQWFGFARLREIFFVSLPFLVYWGVLSLFRSRRLLTNLRIWKGPSLMARFPGSRLVFGLVALAVALSLAVGTQRAIHGS